MRKLIILAKRLQKTPNFSLANYDSSWPFSPSTMKMNSREEKIMLTASNLFEVMRSFAWQNFVVSGRKKFLIHLKELEWRFNHRTDSIYPLLLTQTRHFPR
jgi:hypothetical protein